MTRRSFTQEFKMEAIRLAEDGLSPSWSGTNIS